MLRLRGHLRAALQGPFTRCRDDRHALLQHRDRDLARVGRPIAHHHEGPDEARHHEADAEGLDDALKRRIQDIAKRTYRRLDMSGYARIDIRLSNEGKPYVLEANPNPQIAWGDEFALSADEGRLMSDRIPIDWPEGTVGPRLRVELHSAPALTVRGPKSVPSPIAFHASLPRR